MNHRSALVADLWREYQVDLADMYAGRMRPGLVAALAENLPRGGAVGRDIGGLMAVSPEWEALSVLDRNVRALHMSLAGAKGAPEQWPLPEGRVEREAREAREADAKERWLEGRERRERLRQAGALRLRDL